MTAATPALASFARHWRASATGAGSTRQVREVLVRLAGEGDPVLIADDRAAADTAIRRAVTLAEAAPDSKALKGIRDLAERVGGQARSRRNMRGRQKAGQ